MYTDVQLTEENNIATLDAGDRDDIGIAICDILHQSMNIIHAKKAEVSLNGVQFDLDMERIFRDMASEQGNSGVDYTLEQYQDAQALKEAELDYRAVAFTGEFDEMIESLDLMLDGKEIADDEDVLSLPGLVEVKISAAEKDNLRNLSKFGSFVVYQKDDEKKRCTNLKIAQETMVRFKLAKPTEQRRLHQGLEQGLIGVNKLLKERGDKPVLKVNSTVNDLPTLVCES